LIGQDQLPVGKDIYDLPPSAPLSAIQLRTWIQSVNLALTVTPPVKPFAQYDWPLNLGPRQPIQVFTGSYNKNLIGQDKLPAGKIITQLPDQQRLAAFTWINTVNLALSVKPFAQYDWPNPKSPIFVTPTWIQGFSQFRQPPAARTIPFNQFDWPLPIRPTPVPISFSIGPRPPEPVPPPSLPNIEAPLVRDFWDRDEWGNIIKGYCVRGT
jgi:hypothetical protein